MLRRSSAIIKNEKIKTQWFTVWNDASILKPYTLHTDVHLELGDLFINQFYSKKHKEQALQVWLLMKGNNSDSNLNNFVWKQVRDWIYITFCGRS
jgi:hypothetical protein